MSFSSLGPTWIDFAAKPDLLAPGVGIESLAAPNSALYAPLPRNSCRRHAANDVQAVPESERHQHGGAGRHGYDRADARGESGTDAKRRQGTAAVHGASARGEHFLEQGAGMLNARGAIRMARFFADPVHRSPLPADIIAGESI